MVSVGSNSLPLRRHKLCNLTEANLMAGEYCRYNQGRSKKSLSRKPMKKHTGFVRDHPAENSSGGALNETGKAQRFSMHHKESAPQALYVRKQVDPETANYFFEIEKVIGGTKVNLEEHSVICGNALEEARGKEVELATDYNISHTMQNLLEGCDARHLCGFLQSCANDFPRIALDRSGSHVAETALKSLVVHLQDSDTYSLIEETLNAICKTIVSNPVEVMCNCYGSHVLRSLLCLCKGVPLDSSDYHSKKSSAVLAERLNFRPSQMDRNNAKYQGFPDLLKFLVLEMLNAGKKDITTLQVDHYSSLVLQTALRLLVGNEEELLHIIPILLGHSTKDAVDGNFIENVAVENLLGLMQETAYSHLMEVILEVAPQTLYNELLVKVFKNSLFNMSSHHCGNFVIQALVSHTRNQDHMELIWEELGTKFKELFEMGRAGVVASVIAASQRLHSHEHKCSQALASAVCLENESPEFIVPRILFLDDYFSCEDKSTWDWPNSVKTHTVGSLILQIIFRLPSQFIQEFIKSITSLEADHVLEATKDSGGARVIEAFLGSNSSAKHKRRLVAKLQGHFGALSLLQSGAFTVERCFNASNISLKEAIVSDLLSVRTELSKTKQGPHLLRRLDVDGFSRQPDQWKSRQASKQLAYNEFHAVFGPAESKSSNNGNFLAENHVSKPKKLTEVKREIEASLASAAALSSSYNFLAHKGSTTKMKTSGMKHPQDKLKQQNEKFPKYAMADEFLSGQNRKQKKRRGNNAMENVLASKTTEVGAYEKSSQLVEKKEKKRPRKDLSESSSKKIKQ